MPRNPKLKVPSVRKRTAGDLTDRQERFALEYVVDFDRVRAVRAAGYKPSTDDDAHSMACYLLRNPRVYAVVIREKRRIAEKLGMDAEGTLSYLKMVAMEAIASRDWASAVSALREVGKHYGIYEAHQRQKKYTEADAERLQKELEQVGFSFKMVNDRSEN